MLVLGEGSSLSLTRRFPQLPKGERLPYSPDLVVIPPNIYNYMQNVKMLSEYLKHLRWVHVRKSSLLYNNIFSCNTPADC